MGEYFGDFRAKQLARWSARQSAREPNLFRNQVKGSSVAQIGPSELGWRDAFVGTNGDPRSKLEAFGSMVRNGPGRGARLALFKLCFADFEAAADVAALFEDYRRSMAKLASDRQETEIVHLTVPLTTVGFGLKALVKRCLSMPVWGERENERREAFNRLLRAEYAARAPLFDLAGIEAGGPATPQRYRFDGEWIPKLDPRLTNDGAHLNERGQREIAGHLLRFVGRLNLTAS